MNSVKFSFSFS